MEPPGAGVARQCSRERRSTISSAAAEEIVAAEQAIGVPFPTALRTWLMLNNGVQVADGRLDRAPVRDGCFLLDGYHPLSTALIPLSTSE